MNKIIHRFSLRMHELYTESIDLPMDAQVVHASIRDTHIGTASATWDIWVMFPVTDMPKRRRTFYHIFDGMDRIPINDKHLKTEVLAAGVAWHLMEHVE